MLIELYETTPNGIRDQIPRTHNHAVAVVLPATDLTLAIQASRRMKSLAGMPFRMIIVMDEIRQGFIKTINQVAALAQPEFLAYVAQDALAGKHWLKIAMEKLQSTQAGLLAFNNGKYHGNAAFGLVRCAFTHRIYGEHRIFHPGYHSHFADNELTLMADHVGGGMAYAPEALLMEVDYRLRRTSHQGDRELFQQRVHNELNLPQELISRFPITSQSNICS